MSFNSRKKTPKVDEENPYWISFSDLMSALLIIFILAAVALVIELTQQRQKIEQDITELQHAEQARRDILHEVRDELAKYDIEVMITDNDTVLRIPENTLAFESNSVMIPSSGDSRESISTVGYVLHQAIFRPFNADKDAKRRFDYLDTVFIEGHTDSLPTKRKMGNWGLSADRAISLWNFWESELSVTPSFGDLTNAFGNKLFSVSGYAATRRVNKIEETKADRRANRRIDIRFTVKRPSISQLEDIIEK
jgi:flagellar motor protein MotB